MRTDATIDRGQVLCRNADRTGYGKVDAKLGDLIWWRTGHQGDLQVGRMVGRVRHAPALDGDKGPIERYILVGRLSSDMTYVSEFWVNPEDVTKVEEIRNQTSTLRWFLSDHMVAEPIGIVRRCLSEMWSSWDAFMDYLNKKGESIHPTGKL